MKNSKIIYLIAVLSSSELFFSEAYGYIDPSSGTMIFQMIIGALVGVGIAIKLYWEKLKFNLSKLRK